MVDPSCAEDEWAIAHAESDKKRQFNQNRNLIRKVVKGSIALVPRPNRGVIYCGRVISEFELLNAPPWYDRYIEIRGDEDSQDSWHAADLAQCWKVDELTPVPIPRIPAWIRRSLFGRSTYGIIQPDDFSGDPHDVITRVLAKGGFEERSSTLDPTIIEKRLLDDLTPSTFEHLVVSLLQLENPDELWSQTGGPGDGGVDGVGASKDGQVTGLLQCKWQYWGENPFPAETAWELDAPALKKYLAALRYPDGIAPPDCVFLDRPRISQLISKHHNGLPLAVSLRIGGGGAAREFT
jgi:hypothetical protein